MSKSPRGHGLLHYVSVKPLKRAATMVDVDALVAQGDEMMRRSNALSEPIKKMVQHVDVSKSIATMKQANAIMDMAFETMMRAKNLYNELHPAPAIVLPKTPPGSSKSSPAAAHHRSRARTMSPPAAKKKRSSAPPESTTTKSRDKEEEEDCDHHSRGSSSSSRPMSERSPYMFDFDKPAVYERKKYLASTPSDIYAMLNKYGVAVVPSVFSKEEAAASWREMLLCLEDMYDGFKYEDKSTWGLLRKVSQCKHGMLFQHLSVGWAQFAVDLRQDKRMADLFAGLWTIHTGAPVAPLDLLCAPDGFSCYLNSPKERGGFYRIGHDSLHSDQAGDDTSFSVQSFVNLKDTEKGGACFHFLEGSHLQHAKFFRRVRARKEKRFGLGSKEAQFTRFTLIENQEQLDFFTKASSKRGGRKDCPPKCIAAEAGDVVLWDSRTTHTARQAIDPRDSVAVHPDKVYKRGAVYACMQPRSMASDGDLKKKIQAFIKLSTTTHNAAVGVTRFADKPRTYGRPTELGVHPIVNRPWLSELGYSLFGLNKRIVGYPYDPETHKMIPASGGGGEGGSSSSSSAAAAGAAKQRIKK